MGTVGYMSPEQVRGLPADDRSDLFSFGTIVYEMLSGNRAFKGETSVEIMSATLKQDPPELSQNNHAVPPSLDRIVRHCLEKNPEERFQSASDVAFALSNLSEPSGASAPLCVEEGRSGRARHRWPDYAISRGRGNAASSAGLGAGPAFCAVGRGWAINLCAG